MPSFKKFKLSDELLRSVEELGYTTPTPIQQQTIPLLLEKPTDLIGLAATGTGKTAAFSLPLLERLDSSKKSVQALVLCPTRELALQVAGQIEPLGKHKQVRTVTVYGGASYVPQIRGLEQGAMVVVGTPGRIIDLIGKKHLKLDRISTLVLDEADEMISMGFKEDLETILGSIPREKSNIWLFSATMSKEVRRVADSYLKNPAQVQVNKTEMLSSTVEQIFYHVRESDKPEVLCKIIEAADDFYGIIFCQTKELVKNLAQYMSERGYKVDSLHGDKDQNSREKTMLAFRSHKLKVLVCTDVASRGLDVKDVTHVINYSIPRELDLYVHRIGRTARSGKQGVAISLVSPSHRHLLARVEKMTNSKVNEAVIPTRKAVGAKRIQKILPQFLDQKFHSRVKELLGAEWASGLSEMDKLEIASRFISMIASDVFQDREKAPALQGREENSTQSDRGGRDQQTNRRPRFRNRGGERSKGRG